jgi:hypothetical protein
MTRRLEFFYLVCFQFNSSFLNYETGEHATHTPCNNGCLHPTATAFAPRRVFLFKLQRQLEQGRGRGVGDPPTKAKDEAARKDDLGAKFKSTLLVGYP